MDHLRELLESLTSHAVEFLVIGAHAVSFHGYTRATDDLHLWVGRDSANADRLAAALEDFGAPIGPNGAEEFTSQDRKMIRMGIPPTMVDILNFAEGPTFEEAWQARSIGTWRGVQVPFLSRDHLVRMKRATGRTQDLADLERLEETIRLIKPEPRTSRSRTEPDPQG
jgi:hypothetical protein